MSTDYIFDKAKKKVLYYDTRNPFIIARESGIKIEIRHDFKRLKGMYSVIKRNRFIFINGNLPEQVQQVICAHELGHDALHREIAKNSYLQEFMLYDMKSRPEYEANVFAAHLLLDEEKILELSHYDYDVFQVADKIKTDINLLLIKLNEMNQQGYRFNIPYIPHGDYLGRD